jgi:lipopolysaccharide biosynthesis regulator YciM
MTNAAAGAGEALPVTAETGPPVGDAQAAALALAELALASERYQRAVDKSGKAEQQAADLAATAVENLSEASAALEAAEAAAKAQFGDEVDVGALASMVAAETARHQEALAAIQAAQNGS